MAEKFVHPTVRAFANAITLIVENLPNGLQALLGKAPKPSEAQLRELIDRSSGDFVKVQKDIDTGMVERKAMHWVEFEKTLSLVAWDDLVTTVQIIAGHDGLKKQFKIYCSYATADALGIKGFAKKSVAAEFDISESTAKRVYDRFPVVIAQMALRGAYLILRGKNAG